MPVQMEVKLALGLLVILTLLALALFFSRDTSQAAGKPGRSTPTSQAHETIVVGPGLYIVEIEGHRYLVNTNGGILRLDDREPRDLK